ncbi:efflux RND transporter periplasmic adaptor subunit [Desulfosarcina ovata]|uniref:Hemolysin D n=1 Tax=Desulfosarcina ovata subsp. ovata TaxID=2752305 RepID=A0A5K8AAB6_9BACT|nr:efflux RND transporter periplasmic adaptor subunit [Desulfosarcina ovata]BBO89439.1 hemolysin D [Desulfosarcina ovata subsp. ovata]
MNQSTLYPPEETAASGATAVSRLRTLIACTMIIALGIAGAGYIMRTAPQAQKRPPQRAAMRVSTQPLFPGTYQVTVSAMGAVVPAREITLKTRVSGAVQSVHPEFVEGGLIRAGQKVLKIDAKDYQLAIARQESAVVDAEYALKVEMGYQDVARREWDLLNPGQPADAQDAELVLRKPHLAKAQSDLAAARAELEQARLNLSRTDVVAPFNAVLRVKNVSVGSQVTTQDALAELVGTDEYWIQVSLPMERLAWIRIPRTRAQAGAEVTVFYRGHQRKGTVARLLSDLETEGRMARILVSVKDPLGLADKAGGPPMLIGEYVRVEIQGRRLTDVYRIPRTALRDNSTIWILSDDNRLVVLPVKTVWRDADYVLMKNGITPGQRLIVSDLATPVEGIPLMEGDGGELEPAPGKSSPGGKSDG